MRLEGARVLLTGGAGFIGSHVARRLLSQRAEVHVVDNLFTGNSDFVPEAATLHEVDVRDRDSLTSVVIANAPDAIIHLAAIHYLPYCNSHPETTFNVNTRGTRHLLSAARELDDLRRVIFGSSAAVYPPRDDSHAETDMTTATDLYSHTKLVGETFAERFSQETAVPTASARLFNVYGPNETNPHLIPTILNQLQNGREEVKLGNLKPKRDFIYVADVADALVTLLTDFEDGYRTFNVGTGIEWSIREVVEQITRHLDNSISIKQDEERIRESDRLHLCADPSRIERELGWSAETQFSDGLRMHLESRGLV